MVTITKSGSKITVGSMNHEGGNITKKIFDLKDHKNERVRVHIDTDDKYTIETKSRQKLLVCELDIPKRKYIHTGKVVNGESITESSEMELKLSEIYMKEYLKEEEKL
jgi:hypothetical protein